MASKILQTREKLYEGSSKIMYESDDESVLIQFFKDDMLMQDGTTIQVSGKGVIKNNISAFVMEMMDLAGINNHFFEKVNMREQQVQIVEIVPVKVCVSNVAAGRYVSQFGIEEGYVFDHPIIDYRVKNREKGYPSINEQQMDYFGWIDQEETGELAHQALRVNDFLSGLFAGVGIRLVECQLEFGRIFDGLDFAFILADEITPDNCRLWDLETNQKLDFEYAAENPENAISIYKEIAKRFKLK